MPPVQLDDNAPHQVRFTTTRGKIRVSCTCRRTTGDHAKAGKLYFAPIDTSRNLDEARELYNDPDNHWGPFGEGDKAKW